MTATYEPLETTTLNSAQGTITFSSISSAYTDLVLVAYRTFSNFGTGAQNCHIRFNNDSGSNYNAMYIVNGTESARVTNLTNLLTSSGGNEDSNQFSSDIWHFQNYSNTTTYKPTLFRYNFAGNGRNQIQLWFGQWRSTAAINRIDILGGGGGTFAIGSTFTLYGIKAE